MQPLNWEADPLKWVSYRQCVNLSFTMQSFKKLSIEKCSINRAFLILEIPIEIFWPQSSWSFLYDLSHHRNLKKERNPLSKNMI